MGYVQLLIATYEVSRTAHALAPLLCQVRAEQGKVFVPSGFVKTLIEFHESLSGLSEAQIIQERETENDTK